jgi:hypothetical protein
VTKTSPKENKGGTQMKIYKEVNYSEFEFWSGAIDTVKMLTLSELEKVWEELENCWLENNEMPSETDINDFFWFEKDTIAEWLGYEDWEKLEEERN